MAIRGINRSIFFFCCLTTVHQNEMAHADFNKLFSCFCVFRSQDRISKPSEILRYSIGFVLELKCYEKKAMPVNANKPYSFRKFQS